MVKADSQPDGAEQTAPTAGDVDATRDDVQSVLIDMFGKIEITQEKEFTFPFGSTRIFIDVFAIDEGTNVVNVYAIANVDVPPSEELFRFIALNADASLLGHLGAIEREGVIDILFSHRLLAETLGSSELKRTVATVATAANEMDDVITERFGGRRYRDVVQGSPPPSAGPSQADQETQTPGYL